jgi:hypothetical protein
MVQAMDDTLPTIEVPSAAESYQANVECKVQSIKYPACNFVVEGARWDRY